MKSEYKSRVYTDRPDYADFEPPAKFQAIQGIIARRLREHPKAICSYSGGSDSDTLIDLIERTRRTFHLPPVRYVFFNTGLEMRATRDHVKATAQKYGVEIEERRPKTGIVTAVRRCGIPFISKVVSQRLETVLRDPPIPLCIADEFDAATDKQAKYLELAERYPKRRNGINFICGCRTNGGMEKLNSQAVISSYKWLREFLQDHPPDFQMSAKCCNYCKKKPAHEVQRGFELIITGERRDEGGNRSFSKRDTCFDTYGNNQFRLKPLFFVSDKDKAWYKDTYGLHYSAAYEVYGLTRTGCCGCPISYKAVEDLELIRPHEPNLVKAAWNVFGKSYEYRRRYNEYKAQRMAEEKNIAGQMSLDMFEKEAGT